MLAMLLANGAGLDGPKVCTIGHYQKSSSRDEKITFSNSPLPPPQIALKYRISLCSYKESRTTPKEYGATGERVEGTESLFVSMFAYSPPLYASMN